MLSVAGLRSIGVTNGTVPFDLLGDASSLKRGDPTHTLGYPSGTAWGMPVSADRVATSSSGLIQFESSFLYPGNSGGALLNRKYELIGLVRKDQPPNGEAANIDTVIEKLKSWGYSISLRPSAAANVVPSGPGAVIGGVRGGGTTGNQSLPNFAGVWESFEAKQNGAASQSFHVSRITIAQNGSIVHMGRGDLRITAAGTFGYQTFAAGSPSHSVSAEEQADLVSTLQWRLEGEILVFENILRSKNQNGGHPPGTAVLIIKYRRVSGDSSGPTPPPRGRPAR